MCGPEIPGEEPTQVRQKTRTAVGRGKSATFIDRATRVSPFVQVETAAQKQVREQEAVRQETRKQRKKQKSGGRQSTVQAGSGIARESRRRSLLAAADAADQQRKSLLGQ